MQLALWWMTAWAGGPAFVEPEARAVWSVQGTGGTFGWVTEPVDDLDGDGVRDVVTGAPFLGAGVVVVLSGATGAEWFRVPSDVAGSQLSYDVSPAGDVNDDGVPDVIAGGPAAGAGIAWVLSGGDGSILHRLTGEAPGDRFGESVADVGDVDGDGHDDVAVGAMAHATGGKNAGRVYVLSGADAELLLAIDGTAGANLGSGLGSIPDFDGDGVRDLVVGASNDGKTQAGSVSVYSSRTGKRLMGPAEPGPSGRDRGRWFVGDPGDLDGDEVPDVFAGDFAGNGGSGLALVFSGATGQEIRRWTGAASEGLGVGREAGDVDGDGVGDLAVGSWQHAGGAAGAGRVTVFSGADGRSLKTWTSVDAGENLGFDAVGIGDVDGDGGIDILASGATENNVYVLAGDAPPSTEPTDPSDATDSATDSGMPPDTDAVGACGCANSSGSGGWLWGAGLLLLWRKRGPHG